MILYKKYVFNDVDQYKQKIAGLPEDLYYTEIVLPSQVLVTEQPLGDEELTEDPIEDNTVAVDMLWEDITESPYGWKTYEVNPTEPWNRVLGIDQE